MEHILEANQVIATFSQHSKARKSYASNYPAMGGAGPRGAISETFALGNTTL